MLVLSRKLEEGIKIGDNIEIKILGITGEPGGSRSVRAASIGIEAPREIAIWRHELVETRKANAAAVVGSIDTASLAGIAGLLKNRRSL